MRLKLSRLLAAAVFSLAATSASGDSNGIFPALPAAQKAISWKDGFFVINGRPTFLASGEIHYARVPRELWKDRILRVKAMGFNTIQTYCMWNAHEGKEGEFDFSGPLDLDAWLKTIQECGMYAIVRPGPYVCAEWENGGLPAWLCSKPGMQVRTNHPEFLKYADRYMAKCHEIIAKHQIHKGGNVLMVQLENELPRTWGTDTNAYTQHLYEQARAAGLEIPLFNSGLHHGDDPAGNQPFPAREIPWYSTEFWTGWINLSGEMNAQKFEEKVRGTWKIIAFGGAGYDYYVVHGGSNFGYSKGSEVTASYDYASPIGEMGQLRKAYYPMKRAAMFATAFDDLLASAKNGTGSISATAPGIQTYVRTGPNGTAIFLADVPRFQGRGGRGAAAPAPAEVRTQIRLADGRVIPSGNKTLRLEPGEIRPILTDVPLAPNLKIDYAATAILTRKKMGNRTTFICHGPAGEEGEVALTGRPLVTFKYPAGDDIQEIQVPNSSVRLLVVNTGLADRTWIAGDSLIMGPRYASPEGEYQFASGQKNGTRFTMWEKIGILNWSHVAPPPPQLSPWRLRDGAREIQGDAGANVIKWTASEPQPKPMEQYDSYANGWGWYRTTIRREAAQTVTMRFSGAGDVVRIFLNGVRVAGDRNGATLSLRAGDNQIAVLCWNEGRPKMYNFVGPTGMLSARGIWGPVMLIDKPVASITQWRAQDGTAAENAPAAADFNDAAWPSVRMTSNIMNGRVAYGWFRSEFEVPEGMTNVSLFHQGIDDEGEIFINGQFVGKHVGYNAPGSLELAKFIKPGKNVIAIRLRNNDGAGGISQPIDIVAMKGEVKDWQFSPGLGGLEETALIGNVTNWDDWLGGSWPVAESPRAARHPMFYRSTFNYTPEEQSATTFGLRMTGLRAGSVWVNGHNLGPYRNPESGAAALMYVPEAWLKGGNAVLIFDAEGASPAGVRLEVVESFARGRVR